MRVRCIVADPPWLFGDAIQGNKRGASSHYDCMPLDAIKSFELPAHHPDCLLFLWRVAAMVPEAYEVCEAWGFEPKSEIVWRKLTKTGKPHFGMGHYVRMGHEVCIIARKGKASVQDRATRSVFDAKVGEHSAKPNEFYRLVRRLAPGPYAELFGRRYRPGWAVYGNQITREVGT